MTHPTLAIFGQILDTFGPGVLLALILGVGILALAMRGFERLLRRYWRG